HQTLGEHLALKLLTLDPASDEELEDIRTAAARFQFEAQVAARLSRKTRHIVRVTDHGEEEGRAYLVMELLEGETLEAVLARDTRVPIPTLVKIVTQVARALTQAHDEGVLHRDLKPANVFLTKDEDGKLLVKLLDFGIARVIHAHRAPSAYSTAKGLVFGTPSYMSPEQARASTKLDQGCDLWSLATIAYESVAGDLPVDGKDSDELLGNLCAGRVVPLRTRAPGSPPELDAFFRRAFSEAIGLRFQSANALAQAFARAAAVDVDRDRATDPPVSVGAAVLSPDGDDDSTGRLRAGARRRMAAVGAIAAALAILGIAVAWRALAPSAAAGTERPLVAGPPSSSPMPLASNPGAVLEPPRSTGAAPPLVAFSALPRSQVRPPAAVVPSVPPVPGSTPPAPTPVPTAAPPTPPTAAPSRPEPREPQPHDKSEVL
ncbi:MAG TPA: serine/threonine-protein kinase, partial [Polyangiaceae bacterium]